MRPASASANNTTENETATEININSDVSDDSTKVSEQDADLITNSELPADTGSYDDKKNMTAFTGQNNISNIQSTDTEQKKTTAKKKKKKASKSKKKIYTKSELRLMASIINCEAGGESMQGKIAVGVVIMNRVKSKSFPNTIKKVVYQKGQFSPVRNGSLRKRLNQYDRGRIHSVQWKSCIQAAKKVLKGRRTIIIKGKVKNMKGYHFFSVHLPHARLKLGGHRFK